MPSAYATHLPLAELPYNVRDGFYCLGGVDSVPPARLYRDATRRFAEDHDDAMRGGGPQYTCCAPETVARRETTAESPTRPHYTDRTAT